MLTTDAQMGLAGRICLRNKSAGRDEPEHCVRKELDDFAAT